MGFGYCRRFDKRSDLTCRRHRLAFAETWQTRLESSQVGFGYSRRFDKRSDLTCRRHRLAFAETWQTRLESSRICQVFKPRVLAEEGQTHGADRAVTLLADDDFRNSLVRGLRVV